MAKVTVEVDVDLDDVDSDDLSEELGNRGFSVFKEAPPLLDMDLMGKLHELVRGGHDQEAISVLRPYLLDVLGKAL
ncbi:hypothetical protein ACM1PE_06840 [Achromobacter sp. PD1]|uniref:hypothetical protein n=1 Tax=Achromobacter sp. PD1 TaxID=3399125 RepID=UPI003AF62ECD